MAKKPEPAPSKTTLTDAFNLSDIVDPATGQTRLLAEIDGDKASLRGIYDLIQAGADPNKPDLSGRTPMDAVLARKWYAAADLLIQLGAEPPAYDGEPDGPLVYKPTGTYYTNIADEMKGETPLTYYVKRSDFETLYPIIANGADINKKNDRGRTPLQVAVERGWPHMSRHIVRYGGWLDPDKPDPNEVVDKKTGATRLLLMIQEGTDGEAVKHILDVEGADPNKPDRYGLTPLALARALKWPWLEQLLLDRGADPNVKFPDPNQKVGENNDTPLLTYASLYQNSHDNYFLALLEAGADPNATDKDGKTAALWAAMYGHAWHFDWLQKKGADLFKKDKDGAGPLHLAALNAQTAIVKRILAVIPPGEINATASGQTPLYLACGTGRKGDEELCKLLIANGADVKIATKYGNTVLHSAARKGSPAFIKQLISLGADVDAATDDGTTPINEAISGESPKNLRLLLEAGASVDKAHKGKHYRALFQTVGHGRKNAGEMARLLLEYGADPHQRGDRNSSEGGSIFYHAVTSHGHDVAVELLKAGADPHDTGAKGESAMHHCLNWGGLEGVKLLLEGGFDPLKPFGYPDRWADGNDKNEYRVCTAYDEALRLVAKHGDEREYKTKLKMIEEYLFAPAPAAAPELAPAPAAKKRARPKPGM
ncbi:MAG: ankyrin repeat domain-containing protein [Alphaproteobacteria bacterium]